MRREKRVLRLIEVRGPVDDVDFFMSKAYLRAEGDGCSGKVVTVCRVYMATEYDVPDVEEETDPYNVAMDEVGGTNDGDDR